MKIKVDESGLCWAYINVQGQLTLHQVCCVCHKARRVFCNDHPSMCLFCFAESDEYRRESGQDV